MPPARAATEGMAGASSASASTRLYVRPSVVLPKSDTMLYAIRLPKPDLMKPFESQKAMAISHLQGQAPISGPTRHTSIVGSSFPDLKHTDTIQPG